MDIDLATPDFPMIATFCLATLALILLLRKVWAITFSKKEMIMTIVFGLVATPLSLFYHTKDRWAGTRVTHTAGWPHFLYDSYGGLELGPLWSYVFINIVFYALIFLLVLTAKKVLLSR